MLFHNNSGKSQADARAFCRGIRAFIKSYKQFRKLAFGNASAIVLNFNSCNIFKFTAVNANIYDTVFTGMLAGIFYNISYCLTQPFGIKSENIRSAYGDFF